MARLVMHIYTAFLSTLHVKKFQHLTLSAGHTKKLQTSKKVLLHKFWKLHLWSTF